MWLLSVVLAFGLILGQSAEASGAAKDHQPAILNEVANSAGQQIAPVPACDPGVTCVAFVFPDGPTTALSLAAASVLRPNLTQSQRRIGGPSVTLPPPRTLA